MASSARGRGGRGRPRGGRPTLGGEPVSWDFSDKAIDSHEAQDTFFPDIELPETDPPTARELRIVENYRMLRRRFHSDLRRVGWPMDSETTQPSYPGDIKGPKNPFNAFQSYSQSKYQKKRARDSQSIVKIRWDPQRFDLQLFPKRLRKVIDPTYDAVTNTTAATRSSEQTTRPNKKRKIIEDDEDEEEDNRKDEDDDQEGREIDDEEAEEPDPDDTFSQDDEEMAGDYGDNYFENGEDDDDLGGGADEGGGGDDYE